MGINHYFDNHSAPNEQFLLEELIIESIQIFGQELYYLPRTVVSKDEIYGEDDISRYETVIPIEMYIKSVDGFQGDGVFLSKFGLEIRDQVTFTIAVRRFDDEVGSITHQARPNEGDLIYFPLNKKIFQIRYVNYLPIFYQLGALQTYDITCELFDYSNEVIDTGIIEIDEIQNKYSTNLFDYSILTEDGKMLLTQNNDYLIVEDYDLGDIANADTDELQTEATDVIYWNETNPFTDSY